MKVSFVLSSSCIISIIQLTMISVALPSSSSLVSFLDLQHEQRLHYHHHRHPQQRQRLRKALMKKRKKFKSLNCPLHPPSSMNHPPLVIGHRGSSYNLPEHTLPGYKLALELGADYIEPDLVPTRDGHLVAIHSIDLNITTNVAEIYPNRRRPESQITGSSHSGYYVHDFTLEEIKRLRVKQRVEDTKARSRYYDYLFEVPTLDEIIDLLYDWVMNVQPIIERTITNAAVEEAEEGDSMTNVTTIDTSLFRPRPGLYIELKSSSWILQDTINRSMTTPTQGGQPLHVEDLLLQTLKTHPHSRTLFFNESILCTKLKFNQYTVPPLVLQSFEIDSLLYLKTQFESEDYSDQEYFRNVTPPIVLLVGKSHCLTEEFLFTLGTFGLDGVGPDKECLLSSAIGSSDNNNNGSSSSSSSSSIVIGEEGYGGRDFLNVAIEHKLVVHAWTERLEVEFVDDTRFANAENELRYLFCELKIDGIFSENVDLAVRVAKEGCMTKEDLDKYIEEEEMEVGILPEEESFVSSGEGMKSRRFLHNHGILNSLLFDLFLFLLGGVCGICLMRAVISRQQSLLQQRNECKIPVAGHDDDHDFQEEQHHDLGLSSPEDHLEMEKEENRII